MKKLPVLFLLLHAVLIAGAQSFDAFSIQVKETAIPQVPGVQSFALATHGEEWLVVGGRLDGLHRRQPFATFLAAGNNTSAYVINPKTKQVWSANLSVLPTPLFEQLQSTNMGFVQQDDILYIAGGYGYSAAADDHITHPRLTAIQVPGLIASIKNGGDIVPFFRQISDNRMAVTGGELEMLNGWCYLAGGQRFMGRYNPHGPTHGPGFVQEYTNQIRKFRIVDDGVSLAIADYTAITDTLELHRRDYNMIPQIFPDGQPGFTMFSGVFQYAQDLPWLNTVDVRPEGYTPVPDFNQYLNQYHTANLPAYDAASNTMYTVFFGGIGRYTLDAAGNLVDDPEVPFVRTISLVRRTADGSMQEFKIGEMPAYLGSGAEFIPRPDAPLLANGILNLNALAADTVAVGYLFGGIQSSQPNIFMINDGTQSTASNRLFEVALVKNASSSAIAPVKVDSRTYFNLKAYPNPFRERLSVEFTVPKRDRLEFAVYRIDGARVRPITDEWFEPGRYFYDLDLNDLPKGIYLLRLQNAAGVRAETKIIK